MTTEAATTACASRESTDRQALLLCSDLITLPHLAACVPATARTLLRALRAKQADSARGAPGQRPGAPPRD